MDFTISEIVVNLFSVVDYISASVVPVYVIKWIKIVEWPVFDFLISCIHGSQPPSHICYKFFVGFIWDLGQKGFEFREYVGRNVVNAQFVSFQDLGIVNHQDIGIFSMLFIDLYVPLGHDEIQIILWSPVDQHIQVYLVGFDD